MWAQLAMLAWSAYNKNKQKREEARQSRIEDANAAEEKALGLAQKKDYEENVKPVGLKMVSQGLSQGRTDQFGRAQSVAEYHDTQARRKLNANPNAPMGLVASQTQGMGLQRAQRNAGLVMDDEKLKGQMAIQGAQLLGQRPAYTDLLVKGLNNEQALAGDRSDRSRGLQERSQMAIGKGLGYFMSKDGQNDLNSYWGRINGLLSKNDWLRGKMNDWTTSTAEGGEE